MKQYFVAVGCPQSKLITLVDLLNVVSSETRGPRPISVGIATTSRDALDELIYGLNNVRLTCPAVHNPRLSIALRAKMQLLPSMKHFAY